MERRLGSINRDVVIGLGFGDCGKGLVTDYLCSQSLSPLVIRFSGGQQAGHTVCLGDKTHVFSNFGSGTLRGTPTYWAPHCTIDPIGISNELDCLLGKNEDPLLYIDERCPVTTPYDVFYNQNTERINNHGSCGVGVGATVEREENNYSLRFGDLFYPNVFRIKLDLIKQYYESKYTLAQFDSFIKISLHRFLECCKIITTSENIKISECIPQTINKITDYIFEGSQGLLLDQSYGFFPNVTRSNTGTKNIAISLQGGWINLVTRAYQTRHGNGPMTNEDLGHNIKDDPNETNVKNKYQGEFRKTILDLDLLEYGVNSDYVIKNTKLKSLFITCLDHIENEYRFTHRGEIVCCNNEMDFVQKIGIILGIEHHNIYTSKTAYSENIKRLE